MSAGLLGDKYTRLLDKQIFESLWKYDAIGVGLLFQSDDKPGERMVDLFNLHKLYAIILIST
jgi:hypothetical protein